MQSPGFDLAMDLSPREVPDAPRAQRRWLPIAFAVFAGVAGMAIIGVFLTSSIDYFCNVDEVGVREGCNDDERVRVQGSVDEGSLQLQAGTTSFVMSFNGASLPVVYDGEPGGVFQECIPVVAHGRVVNGTLMATRIEVKHSNEYEAENADRIEESESAACS